jgi:glutathione S-transferase
MARLTFWGLAASPYQLKMQAIADAAELPWRRLPDQGGLLENLSFLHRLRKARAAGTIQRFPARVAGMDEYPAVPYYTLDGQNLYYDSSGLALHLDSLGHGAHPLLPQSGAERFLCRLIDEAFDEFGLYMVHHQRWVTSARNNVMGDMSARELARWLPAPARRNISRRLARRQSRRCPYLFSVAPPGFDAGVDSVITPPALEGFPPTHELLDQAWYRHLGAMEQLLSQQPYLLGERFTLADASAYGQLGMNLVDGRAAELLQEKAPRTFQWLCMIRDGEHRGSSGKPAVTERLAPLLQCIAETFIPLMQQNETAYENAAARGQQRFNEIAFDRGEALYDGRLMGLPFRSVVKSFQVVTWRELSEVWRALDRDARHGLTGMFPFLQGSLFSAGGAASGPGTL